MSPHINDSVYDRLWATCQELAVPICFHAGASSAIQIPAYEGYSPTIAAVVSGDHASRKHSLCLGESADFENLMRLPNLKVGACGKRSRLGRVSFGIHGLSGDGRSVAANGYDLMPSAMFNRQCYLVGWYDRASLRVRKYIGTENILWSSQFPSATSTWPNTESLAKSFDGVDSIDRQKILWENAAKLYRIAVN